MANNRTGFTPPWTYEFREGIACLFCGNAERVVLCGAGGAAGVCEACVVIAHHVWRTLSDGSEPVGPAGRATVVKVLVPRLIKLQGDKQALPGHPASYEFLFSLRGDDKADLPSASVQREDDCVEAVMRALADHGVVTWPSCVEPLYRGHTYRGGIAEVYLVTAYGDVPGRPKQQSAAWRPWPVVEHTGDAQAGFYAALDTVFPLRLSKYQAQQRHTSEVSTYLRRGAVEYLTTQLEFLADPSADTSMCEYLRKGMSDDEKAVCKAVVETARIEAEKRASEEEVKTVGEPVVVEGELEPPGDDELPDDLPGGGGEDTLEAAFSEGGDE